MSKRRKNRPAARDKPMGSSAMAFFLSDEAHATLSIPGYTRLADCPEVRMAVDWIADRVSAMPIKLWENGEDGDIRIRDQLSRRLDIDPNPLMTRKTFIATIVRCLFLEGDGNQVTVPVFTRGGILKELRPVPAGKVSFRASPDGSDYSVAINGLPVPQDEVLHFVLNPDPDEPWKGIGYRVSLRDVTNNLRQAAATKRGFMEDKWKPSVVIRVTDMPDMTPEGRKKLLDEYMAPQAAGEPWLVPTDVMEVQTIKPLSLNDLAINDSVQLDKATVAAMMGVPRYAVGLGNYNAEEHNASIRGICRHVAQVIEQEMTRKIIISPHRFIRLDIRGAYAYSIDQLANIGIKMRSAGMMDGNEVRDWLGLSPREGLSELTTLENYIPLEMIGVQKKLDQGEKDE